MSSIPLAALDIKPPAPAENPLEQYARIAQLQGLANQRQLQQQEIQGAQLENQIRQRQIQDQNAVMDEWSKAPKGSTLADIIPNLQGKVTPQTLMGLTKTDLDLKQSAASLTKAQHENFTSALGEVQKIYNNVSNLPDEELAQQTPQIAAQLNPWLSKMALPGQQAFQVDPSKPLTKAQLQQYGPMLGLYEGYLSQEAGKKKEAAQTSEAANKAAESAAQTEKIKQETQFGPTGPAAEAKYRFILGKAKSGKELSPDELNYAQAFEAANRKTTTQSDSLGIASTNTSGPSGLAAVGKGGNGGGAAVAAGGGGAPKPSGFANNPQANKESIVDEIGQYKTNPTLFSRAILKHPELISMVQQKYPDWDQTTYNAKNKLIEGYTSGTQSKEINAINTAMGHIKNLDDAVDALNNGNMTLLNKIGTAYNINVAGKTPEAAFKLIANRVGPEISSAYIPGGGGEGERIANKQDFDVNLPPQTLHNNASITVKMLRSKIGALENQYKNTVGRDDFEQRFITPEARASLQKFAPQGGGSAFTVTDPRNVVHTFSTQAAADAFKKAANIQ